MSSLSFVPESWNDNPVALGSGPLECSSETALSVRPVWIYDVNGYYSALEVDPNLKPSPTKASLMRAFYILQPRGPEDEWITYAFTQLIKPEVRDVYDTLIPGQKYFDRFEEEILRRKVKDEALRRMADRGDDLLDADIFAQEQKDLFEEAGLNTDTPEEVLDEVGSAEQDALVPPRFSYAYYLWRTRIRSEDQLELLGEWQGLLAVALSRRGIKTKFSVGLMGRMPQAWVMARVGFREVYFLNCLIPPTSAMADALAETVLSEQQKQHAVSLHRKVEAS